MPHDYSRQTLYGLQAAARRNGMIVQKIISRGGWMTVLADLSCKVAASALHFSVKNIFCLLPEKRVAAISRAVDFALVGSVQRVLALLLRRENFLSRVISAGYMLVATKASAE